MQLLQKSNGHYRRGGGGVAVHSCGHRAAAASSAAGRQHRRAIVASGPVALGHVPRTAYRRQVFIPTKHYTSLFHFFLSEGVPVSEIGFRGFERRSASVPVKAHE